MFRISTNLSRNALQAHFSLVMDFFPNIDRLHDVPAMLVQHIVRMHQNKIFICAIHLVVL